MDLSGDTLTVDRELSDLDRAVIEFTDLLESENINYVIVSGYVVILTGRSRATEDVDVVIERLDPERVDALVTTLEDHGYWGMAMPLESMDEMLREGDRIRLAKRDELFPNFEVWFASNDLERTALDTALTAELGDHRVNISPIELQIAYKLRLAHRAGSPEGKDFEDALHLYLTFGERLKTDTLEAYVEDFAVDAYYDELRRV